jgi:hypothetical protein
MLLGRLGGKIMRKTLGMGVLLAVAVVAALALAAAALDSAGGHPSLQSREEPSITVVFPPSGHRWSQTGSCLVKWTYKGNPGRTVNIYLMRGNSPVRTLALDKPLTAGQFDCQLDKNTVLGSDYYVMVRSAENPRILGKSNLIHIVQPDFSYKRDTGQVYPYKPPKVTVLKPAQGINWAAGDPQEIKWQYVDNPPGQAQVLLMKKNQVIKTISAGQYWGQGGTGYIIPYYMPSDVPPDSGYTIKVVSTTDNNYKGTSGEFTITPYCRLIVTQPPNNAPLANWPVGSSHTLTWTYTATCGSHVKVQLHGGVNDQWKVYVLATSWPIGANGSGSFQWTVPPNGTLGINWIPGNQYQLTVSGVENGKCWDWTGKFTVSQ